MTPSKKVFNKQLSRLQKQHEKLINKKNKPSGKNYNGIYTRFKRPVLTANHVPVNWRFDLNYEDVLLRSRTESKNDNKGKEKKEKKGKKRKDAVETEQTDLP